MDVSAAIRSLKATRRYSTEGIDDAVISRWVEVARWCGSSKNGQPWRFIVIRDSQTLSSLAGLGDYAAHLGTCSVAIAVAMNSGSFPFAATFDLGRISQSLMLLAHDDGIGSCVAVFEPSDNVRAAGRLLGVPDDFVIDMAIGFGHPAPVESPVSATTTPSPSRPGRLPAAELLFSERFGNVPSPQRD